MPQLLGPQASDSLTGYMYVVRWCRLVNRAKLKCSFHSNVFQFFKMVEIHTQKQLG